MTSKHRSTCVVVDVIIYAVGQIILMEYCYRYSIFFLKKYESSVMTPAVF